MGKALKVVRMVKDIKGNGGKVRGRDGDYILQGKGKCIKGNGIKDSNMALGLCCYRALGTLVSGTGVGSMVLSIVKTHSSTPPGSIRMANKLEGLMTLTLTITLIILVLTLSIDIIYLFYIHISL